MAKLRKLQKKVLDELFEGEKSEREILDNNGVSDSVYSRWHKEKAWRTEFQARVDEAERRAQVAIAVYKPVAAEKLIELAQCEKEATARQACLDIINMPRIIDKTIPGATEQKVDGVSMTDVMVKKVIEVLAQNEKS